MDAFTKENSRKTKDKDRESSHGVTVGFTKDSGETASSMESAISRVIKTQNKERVSG